MLQPEQHPPCFYGSGTFIMLFLLLVFTSYILSYNGSLESLLLSFMEPIELDFSPMSDLSLYDFLKLPFSSIGASKGCCIKLVVGFFLSRLILELFLVKSSVADSYITLRPSSDSFLLSIKTLGGLLNAFFVSLLCKSLASLSCLPSLLMSKAVCWRSFMP